MSLQTTTLKLSTSVLARTHSPMGFGSQARNFPDHTEPERSAPDRQNPAPAGKPCFGWHLWHQIAIWAHAASAFLRPCPMFRAQAIVEGLKLGSHVKKAV